MQKSVYVDDYYEKYWDKLKEMAKEDERASLSYLVNVAVMEYINKNFE